MADEIRLVVKGVPAPLRRRLAVRAAEDGCFPRDVVIAALEAYLDGTRDAGGIVYVPPPGDTGAHP